MCNSIRSVVEYVLSVEHIQVKKRARQSAGTLSMALTQRHVGGIPQGYFNCSPVKRFLHAKSIGDAFITQQDLSNLANEVNQLESERDRIDDRVARIGMALMEAYPADSRPDLVSTLLDEIDNLL